LPALKAKPPEPLDSVCSHNARRFQKAWWVQPFGQAERQRIFMKRSRKTPSESLNRLPQTPRDSISAIPQRTV
jgi:hypothetical protein